MSRKVPPNFYKLYKNRNVVVKKWIFSAIAHAKIAYDDVEGLCKTYTTKFILQNELIKAIRNSVYLLMQ